MRNKLLQPRYECLVVLLFLEKEPSSIRLKVIVKQGKNWCYFWYDAVKGDRAQDLSQTDALRTEISWPFFVISFSFMNSLNVHWVRKFALWFSLKYVWNKIVRQVPHSIFRTPSWTLKLHLQYRQEESYKSVKMRSKQKGTFNRNLYFWVLKKVSFEQIICCITEYIRNLLYLLWYGLTFRTKYRVCPCCRKEIKTKS